MDRNDSGAAGAATRVLDDTARGAGQSTVPYGGGIWKLDPSHTLVEFSVKHMMITTVRGRFADVSGELRFAAARPRESTGEVRMGAASLDTRVAARDEHLRSADFLDAGRHPELTYGIRAVEPAAGADATTLRPGDGLKIIGDLTIRGVTRDVTLEATYEGAVQDPWGGSRIGFAAHGAIDRRDFGLNWNQALEAGGILVGNEVRIRLEVQAVAE